MTVKFDELFFWLHEDGHAFANILKNSEGEDPIDWLVSEVKKKPVKIVKRLKIIGEVIDLDSSNGRLTVEYYDEPIPMIEDYEPEF